MDTVADIFPHLRRFNILHDPVLLSEGAEVYFRDKRNLDSFAIVLTDLLADRPNFNTTLGDIFDRIASEIAVDELGLAFVRTENCLLREGYSNFGLMKSLSYAACLEIRNFGRRSFVDLLTALIHEQVFGPGPSQNNEFSGEVLDRVFDPDYFESDSLTPVAEAFNWIVADALYGLGGPKALDFFSSPQGTTYSRVRDARTLLASITLDLWLGGTSTMSLEDLMHPFLAKLDHNERKIVRERISSLEPKTLDEIGMEIGLTRERVRQIEKKLRINFAQFVDSEELLKLAVHNLKRDLEFPQSLEKLSEAGEPSLKVINSLGTSPLYILAGFEFIQIQDGWVCHDFETIARETQVIFQISGKDSKPILMADLMANLQDIWPTITPDLVISWLTHLGFREYEGYWFSAAGLSVDRLCEKFLEIHGQPLETTALFHALGKDRSERSLANALAANTNVVRVSKTSWALKSLGAREYLGIRDTLIAFIEDNGSTPFDEVQRKFVARYGVKPSSVKAYATSFPLEVSNGFVRKTNVQPISRKPLSKTRNLYRVDGAIALRITINAEHLRGSGSTCPAALVSALSIKAGEKRVLKSDFGDFKISRMTHLSNLSSVKPACEALGVTAGDQLLIMFSEHTVKFKRLVADDPKLPLIRQITNVLPGMSSKEKTLRALDLDSGDSLEAAIDLLRERGELDLAQELAMHEKEN